MIGARDMALPAAQRLELLDLACSGVPPCFYFSYFWERTGLYGSGSAPDVGWFAYSPLAGKAFSRGNATDYWILGIVVSGFGSRSAAPST